MVWWGEYRRLDTGVGREGRGRDMILVYNSTHNKQISSVYIVYRAISATINISIKNNT